MSRKLSFFLALVLAMLSAVPAFAATDSAPGRTIYLPGITAGPGGQANTEEEVVDAASAALPGAVYVSTNAASGNEVIMYQRATDGTLTLGNRFATGGLGLGSGLGSQGALVLSSNGKWLFVVNAGSNEISVFAVQNGGLVLSDKVASGGVRPTSLTIYKNLVYVLNAGGVGNITGFTLSNDGKLAPIANSTRWLSNNGTGAAPAPAQVSFSPKGNSLVVTERATNMLDTYQVDKNGLATGPVAHPSSGVTPFGFAFADEETLVVSEAFGGAVNGSAASSYELEKGSLELISASVPTGQTAACWVVISQDGKYAYTTNAGSASISGYAVGKDGRLTLLNGRAGDTGAGSGPTDATLSHNGRYVYALSPRTQNVVGFAVQADGSLQNIGAFGGLPTGTAGLAGW